MGEPTIRLNVQAPATAAGIASALELLAAMRLAYGSCSNATGYDLWNERATRLDLRTIARLCALFHCDPNVLLPMKGNHAKQKTTDKAKRKEGGSKKGQ